MKYPLILFIVLVSCFRTSAQEQKFSELDSLIYHLYDVISGEAGEARDWELFKSLFSPEAKLIPVRFSEGLHQVDYMSPEDFASQSGPYMLNNGFYEKEIHRLTERFGNIAHVFSTYETYKSASDTMPFVRGINSIQLLFDNNRWWIVNIYWQAESPDRPLPRKYLPE